jgi:hypothetical protein
MSLADISLQTTAETAIRRRMIKAHNHRKRGRALRKQREEEESPS